ncbi:uncharacterized protein K444DRAFT_360374 [Hyaloscypha bicolor E]|uniref:Uncharacterized protein n=1 Tax=Hyaloscypha bicolor E TaxID=1095630 RepID=A0A2J6TG61_9HELO|nr:uncharacterized protein K444DRAFT_360374 [Hyaloscypha bicolor E]PMD62003.1 hypothetical protein K444DRAFT_360374 [Hyaloscypha bicolor E]
MGLTRACEQVPKCQPHASLSSMVPDSGGAMRDLLRIRPATPLCFAGPPTTPLAGPQVPSSCLAVFCPFPPSALLTLIGDAFDDGMVEMPPSVDESAGSAVWRCMPPSRAFSIRSLDYSSHLSRVLSFAWHATFQSRWQGSLEWERAAPPIICISVTPISTRVFMHTSIFSMSLPLFTCIPSTFIDSFLPAPLP